MKTRKRSAKFAIKMASSVRGLPVVEWMIECKPRGIVAHRKGERETISISWRMLIGTMLVHGYRGKEM
jgi:hypothetical protein